jgi:predicted enzyme related to lactoylglutathione lyase
MSDQKDPGIGSIVWRDLTVEDAEAVSGFYREVVGWETRPHDMGDYHDFDIVAPGTGETVAGICHARGTNESLPPQWLVYINVEDVDRSAGRCVELGGSIVDGPRAMGSHRFCVIRDPAGAVSALISPGD